MSDSDTDKAINCDIDMPSESDNAMEEVENMRRMAERGLTKAQIENSSDYVDIFQHILDCYGRINNE